MLVPLREPVDSGGRPLEVPLYGVALRLADI